MVLNVKKRNPEITNREKRSPRGTAEKNVMHGMISQGCFHSIFELYHIISKINVILRMILRLKKDRVGNNCFPRKISTLIHGRSFQTAVLR